MIELLDMAIMIHKYSKNIFEYCNDERLPAAVVTLTRIFAWRSLDNAEKIVSGIID